MTNGRSNERLEFIELFLAFEKMIATLIGGAFCFFKMTMNL